ncbi:MAG: hypothetical protein QG594_133 [Bacteroidota bacterium]|nr:hypothetical protein [Bacteroidota bacterium]
MIKKILTGFCLLFAFVSFAQQGSSSPISNYGIGEVRFRGTTEARSMGGVAVEQDSIHINLENPASFSNLKLTSFTAGGTSNSSSLKTESTTENARRVTLDYLAVGLPMGKFGLGFGLIPYSSVGYNIRTTAALETEKNKNYTGTGGLNKVFLGLGYKINSKWNIGADVNYIFGNIETNYYEYLKNIELGTLETNTAQLSGVSFSVATQFQTKISKKLSIFAGLNYTFENKLTSKNTRVVTNTTETNTYTIGNTSIPFLSRFNASVGIGQVKKWQIGTKIVYQAASNLANHYNNSNNVSYGAFTSYGLGGYYIPDYNSYTNYAKQIVYRAGLRYEKTGLIMNTKSIDDLGFTLGLGLPLTGSFSSVNIGFEMGKRGTTANGLIQQNYTNISVGLSFNDKWFEKRKFN